MAQRKQSSTSNHKRSVTQALAADGRGKDLAIIAKENLVLSPTEQWRTLAPEHKELVVARAHGGETVSQICDDLGIDKGCVYLAAYNDPEYGQRLAIAREIGQHALVDKLLEIPLDKSMTTAEKELLSQNIKWVAARVAKSSRSPLGNYNERVEVHERQETVQINLPPEFAGFLQPQQTAEFRDLSKDSDDLSDSK